MCSSLINFRRVTLPCGGLRVYRCGFIKLGDPTWLREVCCNHQIEMIIDLNCTKAANLSTVGHENLAYIGIDMRGPILEGSAVDEKYYYCAYQKMIDENKNAFCKVFRCLAAGPPTILINCLFGKDRTGVVVAVLQELLHVDRDIICDEYKQSLDYYRKNANLLEAHWKKRNICQEEYMLRFEINPSIILKTLDYIISAYGGVKEYLLDCGLLISEIYRIRNKFADLRR